MFSSLRELAAEQPVTVRPTDPKARFEALVQDALQARPILTYSTRLALLAAGQRLGIGRFDANLVIASVQHRLGVRGESTPAKPSRWLAATCTFVALQAAIFAGYWWLAHP